MALFNFARRGTPMLDNATIAAHRLYNQQATAPKFQNPNDLLQSLGAIQAQDYANAKWALGLRLVGGTAAAIEQAITNQTLIRTWPMRGTLHLVAAADLGWMLALQAPRAVARNKRRYQELELDEPTLQHCNSLIGEALTEVGTMSRPEIIALLESHKISAADQRIIYILQRAALEGLIGRGPNDGSKSTFIRLAELKNDKAMDEALAELARRYFTSRGPATLHDFVWWSSLPVGDARAGLESVKSELAHEKIDGTDYWFSENSDLPAAPLNYLLPAFDEYLLAYQNRAAVLTPAHAEKVVPGRNGIFKPIIVINGQVVGTWQRAIKKSKVIITPSPFDALSSAEKKAVEDAAQRFGEFLGLPVEVA